MLTCMPAGGAFSLAAKALAANEKAAERPSAAVSFELSPLTGDCIPFTTIRWSTFFLLLVLLITICTAVLFTQGALFMRVARMHCPKILGWPLRPR